MNNVIGKILIVMQLVFSLCFMCFAGAVYSFQAGWKSKTVEAQSKLKNAEDNVKALQDRNTQVEQKLTEQFAAEKKRADEENAKVLQLETNLQQALGSLAGAEQQRDKHLADLIVAQQEAQARIKETTELRAETKRLRDQANEHIANRRQLEGSNLDLAGQLAVAEEQKRNALKKIAELKGLMRLEGLDPDMILTTAAPEAIEKIDGIVSASMKNASGSAELVEVSVGSDDGIRRGMRLIVYRGSEFICELDVTSATADKAIGRVIEETRNGTIERGDNVTTKL
jgi:hypothetical protein